MFRRLFECDKCKMTGTISYKNEADPPLDYPCPRNGCYGIRRCIGGHGFEPKPLTPHDLISYMNTTDGLRDALRANQLSLRAVIAAVGGSVRIPDDLWGSPPSGVSIMRDVDTNDIILTTVD